MKYFLLFGVLLLTSVTQYLALEDTDNIVSGEKDSINSNFIKSSEEAADELDPLNIAEVKELRDKAEKFNFQTEVNRMMKLIINSLYRNKEIFLRELISNASDAIDKIRLLALTSKSELDTNPELSIKVKAEKENKALHIIDTGIGMTEQDLINNLGTIAKSGTADFLSKMQDVANSDGQAFSDMIGQFGVGFYSAFLVAERVVVTTKHNNDSQYIWESDSNSFSIIKDPRGNTLKRGTIISLYLKEEALDYLEEKTVRDLIKKYSQFINFPIHLWSSKVVEEEVVSDEKTKSEQDEETKSSEKPKEDAEDEKEDDDDENVKVEDAPEEEEKPKTKKVSRTVYDWELINDSKPIWTRKPSNVTKEEYHEFYKSLTHDTSDPFAYTHFIAEGEVTFKSLLYVPKIQPSESFNRYGTKSDNIKLFVRRVFITDEFNDMMPNYLNFIRGVVDSDDLPLNVSRETLQQHKLIKIIKKKLIRKVLDMLKKINPEEYLKFWKEFSTNIKLGIMEDPTNRSRLAKLLRFQSSNSKKLTSLADYVSRAKPNQDQIYFIAGPSREEVENSPFVEGLLSKGYEVLYLVEAVDEYTISALPEFEGKKFQNVAKEGFKLADADQAELEALKASFEPLLKWLSDVGLKGKIIRAQISERLRKSPCALVAGMFGWTGNMERLAMSNAHQKSDDPQRSYYLNQKKTLEINPKHPIIRDLLRRIEADENDESAKNTAKMLLQTATLRSGFMLQETAEFAHAVEALMRESLGIPDSDDLNDEPEDADLESESDQQEQTEETEKEDSHHEEL